MNGNYILKKSSRLLKAAIIYPLAQIYHVGSVEDRRLSSRNFKLMTSSIRKSCPQPEDLRRDFISDLTVKTLNDFLLGFDTRLCARVKSNKENLRIFGLKESRRKFLGTFI